MNNTVVAKAYSIKEYKKIIQAIKTLKKTVTEEQATGSWCSYTKAKEKQNKENFYYSKSLGLHNEKYNDEDTHLLIEKITEVGNIWITLDDNSKIRFPDYPSNNDSEKKTFIYVTFEN